MGNRAKCQPEQYIQFLMASSPVCTATEAARVDPRSDSSQAPAHDAYSRLLLRLEPSAQALWEEVRTHIEGQSGILVIDDTTLDKPYAHKMELVGSHWSGKHHRVVRGINLVTHRLSSGATQDRPCQDPLETRNQKRSFSTDVAHGTFAKCPGADGLL